MDWKDIYEKTAYLQTINIFIFVLLGSFKINLIKKSSLIYIYIGNTIILFLDLIAWYKYFTDPKPFYFIAQFYSYFDIFFFGMFYIQAFHIIKNRFYQYLILFIAILIAIILHNTSGTKFATIATFYQFVVIILLGLLSMFVLFVKKENFGSLNVKFALIYLSCYIITVVMEIGFNLVYKLPINQFFQIQILKNSVWTIAFILMTYWILKVTKKQIV